MPKKTVWEMNAFERTHYSMGGRTFRAVIMLSLFISIAAIGFGFFLYSSTVDREYRIKAWQNARLAAGAINMEEVKRETALLAQLYSSAGEEEIAKEDEAYLAQFVNVTRGGGEDLKAQLYILMKATDAKASYIAMLDPEHERMVFLTGTSVQGAFPPTGSWESVDAEHMDAFVNGAKPKFLDRFYDTQAMGAFIYQTKEMGYRCTAAQKLYTEESDGHSFDILVFMDEDMNHIAEISRMFLLQYILLMVSVMLVALVISIWHLRRTTIKPINELANAARAYVEDRDEQKRSRRYFSDLNIRSGDEIENLALTMAAMEKEAAAYVQHITKISAEKERVSYELALATRIQADMLPNIFPAFPDRAEFDIYASMDPAKEVGGDFYDFFLIDDNHLGLVMADVSGKGVPAALFMMASKILVQNYAMAGKSPKEVLADTNTQICRNNREEMFITVWFGILDLESGVLTAASAGHEYPIFKKPGAPFELVKDKHGFVIGGLENVKYKEYELKMDPGSKLFLYTDGVPEATNNELELFGVERTLEALNSDCEAGAEELIETVDKAVRAFMGDAPQFDDVTMLCVVYSGRQ